MKGGRKGGKEDGSVGRMLVILVLQNRKFRVQVDRAFKFSYQLECMHLTNKSIVRRAHLLLTSWLHIVTSERKVIGSLLPAWADIHSGHL